MSKGQGLSGYCALSTLYVKHLISHSRQVIINPTCDKSGSSLSLSKIVELVNPIYKSIVKTTGYFIIVNSIFTELFCTELLNTIYVFFLKTWKKNTNYIRHKGRQLLCLPQEVWQSVHQSVLERVKNKIALIFLVMSLCSSWHLELHSFRLFFLLL